MSDEFDPLEATRRAINKLVEEIVGLHDKSLKPEDYFREFLTRVLQAIAAPAGAVYLPDSGSNLRLVYQSNLSHVGLEMLECEEHHGRLLRSACRAAQPLMLLPYEQMRFSREAPLPEINPTSYFVFLLPIKVNGRSSGLVEVFQDPGRAPLAQKGFFQFLQKMAELASIYLQKTLESQGLNSRRAQTLIQKLTRVPLAIRTGLNALWRKLFAPFQRAIAR